MSSKSPKVIIIGAGVSGLACARELQHRNYDVLVVEARNRCGGRLKAEEVVALRAAKTPVDVGGALIHGITNNPIYQLCDQMGITTHAVSDCLLLEADGTPVDPEVDQEVSKVFNECLDETFAKIAESHKKKSTPQQSFGALFDSTIDPNKKNLLFAWHQANLELSCGASFPNLGYDWNDDEPYEYTGAHVALQQSWNAVTEGLAEGLDILYDAPIQAVRLVHSSKSQSSQHTTTTTTTAAALGRQSNVSPLTSPARRSRRLQGEDSHVRRSSRSNKGVAQPLLSISDSSSLSYDANVRYPTSKTKDTNETKVQVILTSGKVLQADAVVCTLPLGVLKVPPKQAGHVEFDPPLSPAKQAAIQKLGCGLLNKCVISFPHVFWQDSEFLGVVDDPPHLILNASVVTGQPILVFMFGGDLALQVEDLTDVQIMEMCMNVLRKTCKSTVPEPSDYVVTRWGQDVYARGAFVYIPPGVEGMKQLETMSEPISGEDGRPLILFAGEHTTPYHPSTIHGAFLSGIREAYRLDLNFFPAWNNHLAFEPDHLYKKTFPVKRRFQKTAAETNQTGSQPPPRRRRHGVMTLRKRPPASYATNGLMAQSQARLPLNLKKPTSPSRRSNRIAGEPIKMDREKQDDRTLVRSYESFRDWQVIEDKIFPVYGTNPKKRKTTGQLRARYQQLKGKKPRLDSAILSPWLPPKEESHGTKRIVNGRHDQSESQKSHRI